MQKDYVYKGNHYKSGNTSHKTSFYIEQRGILNLTPSKFGAEGFLKDPSIQFADLYSTPVIAMDLIAFSMPGCQKRDMT